MALSRRLGSRAHRRAPLEAPPVEQAARARDAGIPGRLRRFLGALDAPASRAAVLDAVLAVSAASGPERLAAALIDFSFEWLGGQGWGVVVVDEARGFVWLLERGIASSRRPALTSLASRVVDGAQWVWVDEAAGIGPVPARGRFAALAVPLLSQGRSVAVLVGVDTATRVARAPFDLAPDDLEPAARVFDTIAGAIDVSMRLRRAETLSLIDDLTGLSNSRHLSAALRREVKRAARTGRPLSLLFVDLDGFKGINDRYGHLCGSRALVEASARIQSGARETDIVARFGGDEFALVLPDTGPEGALAVAQRVRVRIAGQPFLADEGIGYRLTASVGVATLPEAAVTPEELLSAADAAMYRVKARGKNGIETAGPLGAAGSQSADAKV